MTLSKHNWYSILKFILLTPHTKQIIQLFLMRWLEYYIGSLDVATNHFLTVSTTHLNPSSSPCFVFAEHASILHVLVFRASICSKSKIYVVPFLLSLVEVPVQGLVCLLRLILAHLLVIFIWTTHTTIFRLQQLF